MGWGGRKRRCPSPPSWGRGWGGSGGVGEGSVPPPHLKPEGRGVGGGPILGLGASVEAVGGRGG